MTTSGSAAKTSVDFVRGIVLKVLHTFEANQKRKYNFVMPREGWIKTEGAVGKTRVRCWVPTLYFISIPDSLGGQLKPE